MEILVIGTPKPSADPADIDRLKVAEVRKVWELYVAGNLRRFNFQAEPPRVVLSFEAPDKDTVRTWLKELPMVAAGLFDMDLIAPGPFAQLSALFADPGQPGSK